MLRYIMPVGKSRRIVIDLDDLDLKRRLYSALAEEGSSLKEWFTAYANDYLAGKTRSQQLRLPTTRVAESPAEYGSRKPNPEIWR